MNKQNKAERLFDVIGEIDPLLIADAETPPKRATSQVRFGRGAKLVASLALSLIVIVGASTLFFDKEADGEELDPTEDNCQNVQITENSLESVIMSAQYDSHIKTVSEEEITFFGSRMKIIWCYEGDANYRVVSVPTSKEQDLLRAIENLKNSEKTTKAGEMPCAVWICYEDGRVITPYLESSAGNVGYAELFEYSPEIEPNSAFAELINELIS